jgi:two-component system chemotaxis sensor kinase CheA
VDLSRYAELFLTESREHLSAINHQLLALERGSGGAEPVGAIFRAVHTVKGMSATMGYAAVAELAHEMETLLDAMRRGERDVTPPVMDALFAAADALETAVELSASGRGEQADTRAVVARLRELGGPRETREPPAPPAPSEPRDAQVGPVAAPRRASARRGKGRWRVAAPAGEGWLIRVALAEGTPLKGVRAFMVVQKTKAFGTVTATAPSLAELQDERFEWDFALRLVTTAAPGDVERALRGVGDVAHVEIDAASDAVRVPVGAAKVPSSAAPPRRRAWPRLRRCAGRSTRSTETARDAARRATR